MSRVKENRSDNLESDSEERARLISTDMSTLWYERLYQYPRTMEKQGRQGSVRTILLGSETLDDGRTVHTPFSLA